MESNDDSFKYLTKEEISALSKEELSQYLIGYKEYFKDFSLSIKQLVREMDEMFNRAIEENKLKYPNRYAEIKYLDTDALTRQPLTQEQINAILGPESEPTGNET